MMDHEQVPELDHEDSALLHQVESSESQPLQELSGEDRSNEVLDFARKYNLMPKIEYFYKASALLLSDMPIEQISNITTDEIIAIKQEIDHKWMQPKMLYFTMLVCSIGAIEQGWAQTGMNGANLYFPKALGIGSDSPQDKLIVGLINSAIYLSTGLVGAWLSEPLNNRLGRRGAIFFGGAMCLAANILSALSWSWPALLFFRIFLGAGMGVNSSTVSVYAAECAPSPIRGGLAVSWQMFTAFGIFVGFITNVAVYNIGPNTWRWQLAAPLVPTLPLLGMLYLCPESPAWYIKKSSQYEAAFRSLRRLRNTELQAAKELYSMYLQRQLKGSTLNLRKSTLKKLVELFTIPRIRRATMASYTIMLSQQLCGINIIAFYSSSIFSDAGFSTFGALIASCIFGFINFIGAFPAIWTMDTLGRRSLLLLTLPFMALTMFAAGLTFNIPAENPAHLTLLAILVYLFCAEYSPGMGPVPNTYSAEVFPLSHRELGMSLAVASANIWAAVLSLTFPRILAALKPQGAFWLYAALNIVAFVLVFLFVPETRLKSLDELDDVFSISSRTFVKYQTTKYVPWLARRYVLRQKQADLKPLLLVQEYSELDQDEDDIQAI